MFRALFILLLSAPLASWATPLLSVKEPYVRATPPVASNSAAFMTLRNGSGQALELVAAKSSVAKHVELHNHINDNGVMRMRKVPKIVLPAKGSMVLQPGSYHIMLIGLHQPIQVGDKVDITLVFADGSEQAITAPARHVMKHRHHGHYH